MESLTPLTAFRKVLAVKVDHIRQRFEEVICRVRQN